MTTEAEAKNSFPSELYEQGDPGFIDAIRQFAFAEDLADFADRWYNDNRLSSRQMLLNYLTHPMNAFRHEGLIKRVFKKAEAARDDEVMARFLVLLDRSIRRVRNKGYRFLRQAVANPKEARELQTLWQQLGYLWVRVWQRADHRYVEGHRTDEVVILPPGTTMPRDRRIEEPKKLKSLHLFSVATRHYLRRRAWRYFRNLGKAHPERYVAAVCEALPLYRDEDITDGLALIDNWGLMHILFHHSPAIEAKPSGWVVRPGQSLADLIPSPIFEPLWAASPGAVVGLLAPARCQAVRRWAIRRIEADPASTFPALPLEGWIDLLGHDDPEVASLAARVLGESEGLAEVSVDRWLRMAETTNPVALENVCDLIERHVGPDQVTWEQAVRLTGLRPLPVAKLGLSWLCVGAARESPDDPRTLLALLEAKCEPLRREILRWLRQILAASDIDRPSTILGFLDSRFADVREVGWNWFQHEPEARDDVETWRKLLESPHDDIRLGLVAILEARSTGDDPSRIGRSLAPEDLLQLWAAVLLNIHRGGRAKPKVVRQMLRRLETSPADAPALLPLLGVALRSVRGPERRAGLVAVVQMVERHAEVEPLVRSSFPELQWA